MLRVAHLTIQKDQGSMYRAQSWLGIQGLADWISLVTGQNTYRNSKFSLLMWCPKQEQLHLGPRSYFNVSLSDDLQQLSSPLNPHFIHPMQKAEEKAHNPPMANLLFPMQETSVLIYEESQQPQKPLTDSFMRERCIITMVKKLCSEQNCKEIHIYGLLTIRQVLESPISSQKSFKGANLEKKEKKATKPIMVNSPRPSSLFPQVCAPASPGVFSCQIM